jgi:hypothetical protein
VGASPAVLRALAQHIWSIESCADVYRAVVTAPLYVNHVYDFRRGIARGLKVEGGRSANVQEVEQFRRGYVGSAGTSAAVLLPSPQHIWSIEFCVEAQRVVVAAALYVNHV